MMRDKKVLAGKLRLVLLKSLGQAYVANDTRSYPRVKRNSSLYSNGLDVTSEKTILKPKLKHRPFLKMGGGEISLNGR